MTIQDYIASAAFTVRIKDDAARMRAIRQRQQLWGFHHAKAFPTVEHTEKGWKVIWSPRVMS